MERAVGLETGQMRTVCLNSVSVAANKHGDGWEKEDGCSYLTGRS